MQTAIATAGRWREFVVFVALCVLVWPAALSALIAAYGVGFWLYGAFAAPPGPAQ
jgi:nitrate reductase NapE component